ncbi:hypothetical protein SEPCBS119000_001730 [Sporothrix epigloea]|uniref:Major facilitator superfamily (MFS) profile domain-containing protein n=1 Tax=Sporothrix epigloea TaxID=1892477 RepID=A0ABP0DC98_9PEZI
MAGLAGLPARTYGGNRAFHNFANDYSHISDPNLRRRLALSEIDNVPLGLYHIRAIAVAGVGFFLDSYDIFAISMVTNLWGLVFWGGGDPSTSAAVTAASYGYGSNNGILPGPVNLAVKASTSAGIIVGQLLFGWLADSLGRRRVYGIELVVIVLATFGCALASPSPAMSPAGLLVFWRVIMGIGIGGDYPLSSVITSEFAPTRWRGAMMAAVFSMQGFGQLLSAIVALVATAAFRSELVGVTSAAQCGSGCRTAADRCWRIIIGFGALPACFALYYRVTIPETPRYTFDVAHDVEKADADIRAYMAGERQSRVDSVLQPRLELVAGPAKTSDSTAAVPYASWTIVHSSFWARGNLRHLRVLLGTMFSWFFLDLAYYGLALNNAVVLEAIGYSDGANLYRVLYNNAVGTIILACAGSLPGYWAAVLTIDTIGRKPLQVFGFLILTLLFCVMGFAFHRLSKTAMLALYVVAQFFFNWGPNTTTFVIPGECFPTRYRSTAHGMSAAMGKIGAIVAQLISIPILSRDAPSNCSATAGAASGSCSPWFNRLMQIFALFMLCGTLVSFVCIPETKSISLEELSGEDPPPHSDSRNGNLRGRSSADNAGSSSRQDGIRVPKTRRYRHIRSSWGKGAAVMRRASGVTNSHRHTDSPVSSDRDANAGSDNAGTLLRFTPISEQASHYDAASSHRGGIKTQSTARSESETTTRTNSSRELFSRGNASHHGQKHDSVIPSVTKTDEVESSRIHQDIELQSQQSSRRGRRRRADADSLHPAFHADTNNRSSIITKESDFTLGGLAYPPQRTSQRLDRATVEGDVSSADTPVFPVNIAGDNRDRRSRTLQATPSDALDGIHMHDAGDFLR